MPPGLRRKRVSTSRTPDEPLARARLGIRYATLRNFSWGRFENVGPLPAICF